MEGVGKGILLVVVKCLVAGNAATGNFDVAKETRSVFFCAIDWNLDACRTR